MALCRLLKFLPKNPLLKIRVLHISQVYLHVNLEVTASFQSGHSLGVLSIVTWAKWVQALPECRQAPGFPWRVFPEVPWLEDVRPPRVFESLRDLVPGKGCREMPTTNFHVIGKPIRYLFLSQVITKKNGSHAMEIHTTLHQDTGCQVPPEDKGTLQIEPFQAGWCFKFNFWLFWVFNATCRLSLVSASGDYSSSQCASFSLQWLLLLQSADSRHSGCCSAQA